MPPCPTSSSISYRSPIVSPTTGEKLPGARLPHASEPHAEPQTSAPDRVEKDHHPAEVPQGDLVRPAGLGSERDQPPEREDPTNRNDDQRPSEPEPADHEREQPCD